MSRKHYKLCLNCENYQEEKTHVLSEYHRYNDRLYNNFFFVDVCKFKLTPQSVNGCERCDKYKSINNKRRK